ncbi:hypothetical protein CNR22_19290 [Sphingobacteriaceae bacterium]|nr:hypothetical protein CNR22_19290 [Sphingobacteriaceae bacterium]
MTKIMTRVTLALVLLFSFTSKMYSQLAPSPTLALTNVPEAALYGVLYQIDIPVDANYTGTVLPIYAINNSTLTLNYNRVAYFMQVDGNWVWVSMNKFNTTNAQLGIPYNNSGIIFQQTVTAMNVVGSPTSGVTSTTGINGNIEIWPDCYNQGASLAGIGGSGATYDYNDTRNANTNCFGSFQVHDYTAGKTLFAWNSFMNNTNSNDDLGIGTRSVNDPDWTFAYNAGTYTTRKLWILVDNGIKVIGQPSTLANSACLNGTISPLTVTTAVLSTTLTNYQWYSNTSAVNSGGTLVATHTSSLTTDSYTPSTLSAGTLYYYCIANGTGTTSAKSNISGAVTIENPTLSITGAGTVCTGNALTLSANSTAAGSTFTWSTNETTSSISVSPAANTTYTVSGTSTLGCIGISAPVTVSVNSLPVISVPNGTICEGASFVLVPSGAASYTYSSGSDTVTPASTSNYTVSGTSNEGCVGTNNLISVTVHTLPVVSITGTNALCEGTSATLTANGAATYTWSTGTNAGSISVTPTLTTTYSLSGTSSDGCVNLVQATTELTVHTLPLVSITGTNEVCAGSSVNLSASGASTYTWNTSETTAVISVTPSANTSYSVSGTSADGCASASNAVTTVTVHALPVLSITSETTAICAGASAGFTVTGASTYTWNNGSTATSISVTPASNTSYSVSGTNSLGCVSAIQAVASITVNALPTVTVSGPSAICTGGSATLVATGASTYVFGVSAPSPSISVNPTVTTSYTVVGISAEGCAGMPVIKTVSVNTLPLVTITGTTSICEGLTTSLVAGGASTYSWTGGLGSSTSIVVSPSVTTVYTLTGLSSAGCSGASTKTLTVNSAPSVTLNGATGICTGQSATLIALGANSYSWSTSSTNSLIVVTPSISTTYSVIGTSALGCSKTYTQFVSVASSLSVSIAGPTVICSGYPVDLDGLGATTYTWNDGTSSSSITVFPTVTTTYSVTGASGTCSNTAVVTVSVNANPTITINGSSSVCVGNSATLTASGADSYLWDNSSFTASTVVTPLQLTSYSVIGYVTLTGCQSTGVINVTAQPLPTLSISGSSAICFGSSTALTASGATSYTWSNGATINPISVSPGTSTFYSVSGSDANGCVNTTTPVNLDVYPNPTITVSSSSTTVCEGSPVTLNASGADSYTWTNVANTATITVNPTASTNYTVIGTTTLGCSSSAAVFITVNANPVVAISGQTIICTGTTVDLSASGASSYIWNTGSTSTSISVSPTVQTSYSIAGTNNEGCVGTFSLVVKVSDCTGLNSIVANTTVKLYPNPTHGDFTVELEDASTAVITIRNVVGQLLLNSKAELVNRLSLESFDNGVYYISITKNNAVIYTKTLIKN